MTRSASRVGRMSLKRCGPADARLHANYRAASRTVPYLVFEIRPSRCKVVPFLSSGGPYLYPFLMKKIYEEDSVEKFEIPGSMWPTRDAAAYAGRNLDPGGPYVPKTMRPTYGPHTAHPAYAATVSPC